MDAYPAENSQEVLKNVAERADQQPVTSDSTTATPAAPVTAAPTVQYVIEHIVANVGGVRGALVASADGFVIAASLPAGLPLDAAAIAAMSAATLGLANRLVQLGGQAPITVSVQRSADAQVFVFAIGDTAALTILADASADAARIATVGRELSEGLRPAFTR